MLEVAFVVGLIAVLVGLGLAALFLSLSTLFVLGLGSIAAGFALGVPAGSYYHVLLYRYLAQRGPVPRSFYWRPTSLHEQLDPAEKRRVMPWFLIGGAGFGLIVLGCLIVMLAVLKA
jgi:hypothetical protein